MPENDTEQEPSIEEILTSIRQIISDDDDEQEEVAAPAPEPDPEPEEEVIELTEKLDEPKKAAPPPPPPPPEPEPEPEPEPIEVEMQDSVYEPEPAEEDFDSVLTNNAEAAAFDAFSELARKTAVEHDGITLEEIVRTELKPLLRGWLDKNLPHIIERLVQEELERVAKRALDD